MKKKTLYIACALVLILNTSFKPANEWTMLLDKKLYKWSVYQSYRFTEGFGSRIPKGDDGKDIKPVGYDINEGNEFSIVMQGGEPVLKIYGDLYGCIFTKQEFENYDLKLKVKWGQMKWAPRLNQEKDSGLLYHSIGECGAESWHTWMLSQEFQITENGMGDYWSQATSMADVRAVKDKKYQFNNDGESVAIGAGTGNGNFCKAGANVERKDDWNDIELITYGDKSLQIVNGVVVMALSNMRYKNGDQILPLNKGKIQLQSEAAEVYYKDIKIKPINGIPSMYASYF
jgi:hypothetical protein